MSPIKGISEARQLPRLGKVRLGIQVEGKSGKSYPKAVDHFVVPPEVAKVFGEDPKELRIMFPVENEEDFAPQWYRCYSGARGLICKGDGVMADRCFDKQTGALATGKSPETVRKEVGCPGPKCPEILKKQCRPVMNLMFLLPEVPGLGVWQLDTSSFYSIRNVNSAVEMLKGLHGHIAGIPLVLSVAPQEATPEGFKKTIYTLRLNTTMTLAEIQKLTPPGKVLMPAPEAVEAPEELYPEEVLEHLDAEAEAAAEVPALAPPPPPAPPVETPAHVGELLTWAFKRLDPSMSAQEAFQALGVSGPMEVTDLAGAWAKLKSLRKVRT